MPELPEVEGYKRYFVQHAVGRTIADVEVRDRRVLRGLAAVRLRRELVGRRFRGVRRHGKHLFADTGGLWLHLHFGMSGDLSSHRSRDPAPRFARVIFHFKDGRALAFEDMRMFGRVGLVPDPDEYIDNHVPGVDPLHPAFTATRLRALLLNRRSAIKHLLLSQELIAGVGNLYADEALFQSGIDPRSRASDLPDADVRRLHAALRRVLGKVISARETGKDLPRSFLLPHRDREGCCPKCGVVLKRATVGGRTTYWCAQHQRRR